MSLVGYICDYNNIVEVCSLWVENELAYNVRCTIMCELYTLGSFLALDCTCRFWYCVQSFLCENVVLVLSVHDCL